MKLINSTTLFFLMLTSFIGNAQENNTLKTNKGRLYIFWGWNRSWYTNSDIRFTGSNYDFELNDVQAKDRQSTFGLDPYFNPVRITIPQTNLRIGYFITNNIDVSLGVDHMKYVMVQEQNTQISGYINDESIYDGTYINDDFSINKEFLQFEHTDGLNYINAEITRNDDLFKFLKLDVNLNKVQVNTLLGFGLGALMPKSNVTLWNNERNDHFHFAGYGFAAKVGLNITFFKYLFFRGELKEGFIDMQNIRTSPNIADKAQQHFFFTEVDFAFGISIQPFN
ncbi:MAG: hypothetical protein CO118_07335 [Flavobacteriales bacterium CG_4_9_14_3_um_filter_32_8]|nr:MAG: hypothetical protein CO118_07335 [Flavobacteriales bacterium CG_4_9_14_3_um_filter_32_8]